MKRRSEQILRRFVKNSQARLPISDLEQEFGISERTLRADIAECNEFLRDLRTPGLFINDAGRLQAGEGFDSGKVYDALGTVGLQHYRLSREERLTYIELLLLWDDSYQSMQDIADQLGVSRITIMKDVDALRSEMAEGGIEVSSEAGKGVRACGPVDRRIDLLVERLRDLALELGDEAIFQRLALERLAPRYSFEDIYAHARDYLDPNSLVVTDEAFYNVILCLFVLLNAPFDVSGAAPHKGEFTKLDGMLAYVCGRLGADPSRDRLVAFANYLEEHHIGSYVRTLDEIEFYEVVIHFLMNLDRELGTSLSSDDVLANALLLHLKSMRDWGDLDFDFTEEDAAPIDYVSLERAVRSNLQVLQKYLNYEINDSMVKSIMLHVCVSLIRSSRSSEKPIVAIVCPGSMATGRYLETQVKSYFDFDIVGVYPEHNFDELLDPAAPEPDLVISTVPLRSNDYRNVTVHAVLTMDDLKAIKRAASEVVGTTTLQVAPKAAGDERVGRLVSYLGVADLPADLRSDLLQVIDGYRETEAHEVPSRIGELMARQDLVVDDGDITWEEGIRRAGGLLVREGCVTSSFVDRAVETVHEYGDYIVIAPGVALAHAGAENGVVHDGLSLLVSHRGIPFTNPENVVNFLFCFASRGVTDYIDLFAEIINIGRDAVRSRELLEMGPDELYEALSHK